MEINKIQPVFLKVALNRQSGAFGFSFIKEAPKKRHNFATFYLVKPKMWCFSIQNYYYMLFPSFPIQYPFISLLQIFKKEIAKVYIKQQLGYSLSKNVCPIFFVCTVQVKRTRRQFTLLRARQKTQTTSHHSSMKLLLQSHCNRTMASPNEAHLCCKNSNKIYLIIIFLKAAMLASNTYRFPLFYLSYQN